VNRIKDSQPDITEFERPDPYILVQVIKYVPKAEVRKVARKKLSENITAMSIATGEIVSEKTLPFVTLIQIIDGEAEVVINKIKNKLKFGDGIVIPAHTAHSINANSQFKMVSTIVKSGYEL